MEFITVDDVNDAVLQISEEDVVAANAYVNSLAKKFRVTDDSKLLNPPVYTIKRIAICYAWATL